MTLAQKNKERKMVLRAFRNPANVTGALVEEEEEVTSEES
tara:strand:- start:334 stop:453 length:120 start_codon:yes stop_codon:yes gene_type:complete